MIIGRMVNRLLLPALSLCVASSLARGQDSLSSVQSHAVARPDSLRSRVMLDLTSFRQPADSSSSLQRAQFRWTDVYHLGGLLRRKGGIILRELGEAGLPEQLLLTGSELSLLLDGHPWNDPVTGLANLHVIPLEDLDGVEIDGPVLAPSWGPGGGSSAHLLSHPWWTSRPVTKLRFFQGPDEHLLTDGSFSQNVTRTVNLTAGVQRHVANGRYQNAGFESWNVRTRVRWNPGDRLNVLLTYFYTDALVGMNGGVYADSTFSIYEPASATVRFPNAREETGRHDVTAIAAVRPLADSSWKTTLRLFSTSAQRTYVDSSFRTWETIGSYAWNRLGARIEQRIDHPLHSTVVAVHGERRHVQADTLLPVASLRLVSLSVESMLRVINDASPAVFFKEELIHNRWYTSAGFDLSVSLFDKLSAGLGASRSYRLPTTRDMSLHLGANREVTDLVSRYDVLQIGLRGEWKVLRASVRVRRTALDRWLTAFAVPALLSPRFLDLRPAPISKLVLNSVEADINIRLWKFVGEAGLTFQEPIEALAADPGLPRMSLFGEVMWSDTLFDGHLTARAGGRIRHLGPASAIRFHPAYGIFSAAEGPRQPSTTCIDLVAVARIGDAFLQITWENITNAQTYRVLTYPLPESGVSIGVNWVFFD